MNIKLLLIIFFCFFIQIPATATNNAFTDAIIETVKTFVHDETRHLPGKVVIKPGKSDSRLALQPCQQLEPFLPPGGRVWGRFSVGVRCRDESTWTLYIPVEIEVIAKVVHTAQPVSMGKLLSAHDVVMREVDLVRISGDTLNDPEQVIGKVAATSLASGQPLRRYHLRAPHVISRGQKVQLVATGPGFTVSTEGDALAAAAEGEIVQVRNHTGRIINGIARQGGIVEVKQ
jgi:flagella basal body P-ring formation protein FlgA